jgi:hypothetical protein
MFIATINKPKQLLFLTYIGHVRAEDLAQYREEVSAQLTELSPGFRLLVDFCRLESMDRDCAPEIGRTMEMLDCKGLEQVVRVIPDPGKDIGMIILGLFHYSPRIKVVTCQTMAEAIEKLQL